MFQTVLADALHPKALHLILLPTEQCNFRCAYCYENFEVGRMAPGLVRGIKALIDRRIGDLLAASLSWFGGEPLAAKDVVFDIAEHLQRRCREHGVANLGGSLTTNGYLLNLDTARGLRAVDQGSAQITLDGLGAVHDRTRPLASGGGSFNRIWANLLAIRDSQLDFQVAIRVHVGAAELPESEALCREINCQFGRDGRFSVYFRPIANWGGRNRQAIKPMSNAASREAMACLASLLTDVPHNAGAVDDPYICYASRPNTWLIRADGRVARCTVALEDPRNTVGYLEEDGRLLVDKESLRPWLGGYTELDRERLACPYSSMRKSSAEVVPVTLVKKVQPALSQG